MDYNLLNNSEIFQIFNYNGKSLHLEVFSNNLSNLEYIDCYCYTEKETKFIYISLLEPMYLLNDDKFTKYQKDEFISIIKSNWDNIRSALIDAYNKYICAIINSEILSDKSMYEDKGEINIPISCPDYSVLETED